MSKELQKILDLDKSEKSSDEESAAGVVSVRPSAPAPRQPALGGVNGLAEESPVSSPRVRPRAAKTRDTSGYKPVSDGSRPPLQSVIYPITQPSAVNGPAPLSSTPLGGNNAFGKGGLGSPARIHLSDSEPPQNRYTYNTECITVCIIFYVYVYMFMCVGM